MPHPKVFLATATIAVLLLVPLSAPSSAGVGFDVSATISDGVTTAVPGTTTTYVLTVSNEGPGSASFVVTPSFSTGTVGNWTCGAAAGGTCSANGSGAIADPVSLDAGSSVTYTIPLSIPSSATGTLTGSIVLNVVGDLDDSNDAASDDDTLTPQADLSITKTDGLTTVKPGQVVTYTVIATNNGPSDATGTVADTIPAALGSATWTCTPTGAATCGAGGSGAIADPVSLPAGETATYTITATVDPEADAGDSISQSATLTPDGPVDASPGNNSATDLDAVADLVADLVATKTAPATAVVGGTISYAIGVRNDGPDQALEVVLADPLPADTTFVSMTQTGGPAATMVTPAVGSGGQVSAAWAALADDAVATFTVVVQLGVGAEVGEAVTNTATVVSTDEPAEPAGEVSAAATVDPALANNAASATTIIAQATTTTTTMTTTTTSVTTTTAAVGAGDLARTGVGSEGPVGLALFVAGAGLVLVGAAELRRIRATMR